MPTWYDFATVDVFTTIPYEGNPLAIVRIPKDSSITQEQKDKIAKEFNLSETVFLHEDYDAEDGRRFDIFTIQGEIPWAGHPTIGTICYIGNMEAGKSGSEYFSLKSRAGLLKARFNQESCFAEAEIPFNFHVHSRGIPSEEVLQSQAELQRQLKNIQTSYPIASIVNGMNFVLVELTTLEELSHVSKGSTNLEFESDYLDTGWNRDILDIYFFTILSYQDGITKIRARMIDSAIGEDPATGSAASALACYLSHMVARGQSIQIYEIEQGVEMGRRSLIKVRVELNETGIVKQVILSGQAVKVQKGKILI